MNVWIFIPIFPIDIDEDVARWVTLVTSLYNSFLIWFLFRKLNRQARDQQRLKVTQSAISGLLEDPHAVLCRVLARATAQKINSLTVLSSSANPPYLLLREDNTRRRLLLAGAGNLKKALRAAKIRGRLPRKQRRTLKSPAEVEAIAAAWIALAPALNLPQESSYVESWELVVLPPDELECARA